MFANYNGFKRRLRILLAILMLVNVSNAFAAEGGGGGSYCCNWASTCYTSMPVRDITICSSALYQTTFWDCTTNPGCGYYGGNLSCGYECPD